MKHSLSVIIPCFNEEETLQDCISRVMELEDHDLTLQIIIVDDASSDRSKEVAALLMDIYPDQIILKSHEVNQGKGAALRTGFKHATGDYVVVQDADLEYNPLEIRQLLEPLLYDKADVVYGSRFLSGRPHRVLYYWHSVGNRFLTTLSNMFTDLNLTDMETCYKVFKREIIQDISIRENRFGFEPEITAKIAQKRCRIFEMGISYEGRTYEEGKKIGWKDGFRALYCILRYNAFSAPMPIQIIIYLFIGGASALLNLVIFLVLYNQNISLLISTVTAFVIAAIFNYYLSIALLFRKNAKWRTGLELFMYAIVVLSIAGVDYFLTGAFLEMNFSSVMAKLNATIIAFVLNFLGRKYIVFPEKPLGKWQKQRLNKTELKKKNKQKVLDNKNS